MHNIDDLGSFSLPVTSSGTLPNLDSIENDIESFEQEDSALYTFPLGYTDTSGTHDVLVKFRQCIELQKDASDTRLINEIRTECVEDVRKNYLTYYDFDSKDCDQKHANFINWSVLQQYLKDKNIDVNTNDVVDVNKDGKVGGSSNPVFRVFVDDPYNYASFKSKFKTTSPRYINTSGGASPGSPMHSSPIPKSSVLSDDIPITFVRGDSFKAPISSNENSNDEPNYGSPRPTRSRSSSNIRITTPRSKRSSTHSSERSSIDLKLDTDNTNIPIKRSKGSFGPTHSRRNIRIDPVRWVAQSCNRYTKDRVKYIDSWVQKGECLMYKRYKVYEEGYLHDTAGFYIAIHSFLRELEVYYKALENDFNQIARFVGWFIDSDSFWFVTRCEKETLQQTLIEYSEGVHPFTIGSWPEFAADLYLQIVHAVSFLHTLGFNHNDLKLTNILYSKGKIFLFDFDTSQALDDTLTMGEFMQGPMAKTLITTTTVLEPPERHILMSQIDSILKHEVKYEIDLTQISSAEFFKKHDSYSLGLIFLTLVLPEMLLNRKTLNVDGVMGTIALALDDKPYSDDDLDFIKNIKAQSVAIPYLLECDFLKSKKLINTKVKNCGDCVCIGRGTFTDDFNDRLTPEDMLWNYDLFKADTYNPKISTCELAQRAKKRYMILKATEFRPRSVSVTTPSTVKLDGMPESADGNVKRKGRSPLIKPRESSSNGRGRSKSVNSVVGMFGDEDGREKEYTVNLLRRSRSRDSPSKSRIKSKSKASSSPDSGDFGKLNDYDVGKEKEKSPMRKSKSRDSSSINRGKSLTPPISPNLVTFLGEQEDDGKEKAF